MLTHFLKQRIQIYLLQEHSYIEVPPQQPEILQYHSTEISLDKSIKRNQHRSSKPPTLYFLILNVRFPKSLVSKRLNSYVRQLRLSQRIYLRRKKVKKKRKKKRENGVEYGESSISSSSNYKNPFPRRETREKGNLLT